MNKIRLVIAALLVIVGVAGTVAVAEAAPPAPSGTIVLNETGPFTIDSVVTFTTAVMNLKGNQWPMVYVVCHSTLDGDLLVGQLDHPDAEFIIGAGSSPWRLPPNVGEDGTCVGVLYAYSKQAGGPTFLAQTAPFAASGT